MQGGLREGTCRPDVPHNYLPGIAFVAARSQFPRNLWSSVGFFVPQPNTGFEPTPIRSQRRRCVQDLCLTIGSDNRLLVMAG